MAVAALDGRRLGYIHSMRSCCFEVVEAQGERVYLKWDALFDVNMTVELICLEPDLPRYHCPLHTKKAVKTG